MKMRILLAGLFALVITGVLLLTSEFSLLHSSAQTQTAPSQTQTMPDVIILGKDAKLGQVTFNHKNHNGGKYSIDQNGPIECISCHHTAQPASEIAKHPPLQTSWPADRTTTLTAELWAKDPKNAGVAACRDCHARAGEKPKLLDKIPEIKHEGSTAIISVTNQQAFHRACAGCHVEVKKTRPTSTGPITTQCTMCHKKTA